MVHADADGKLEGLNHFGKDGFDAAAESEGLGGIRLWQEQSELVTADSECRVRGAQRFLKSGGCGAQDIIATRVAVLVVHFLEAVKVQDHQTERLAVAASAIQFLFEGFTEKPAVVQTGQGIGNGIQFEFFQFFIFDDDGDAKKSGACEHVHESGFQGNLTARQIGQLTPANEHLIPNLYTLSFAQIEVSDCAEKTLEELSARGQIETLERIRMQLEIGILDRQARGRRGAGAGHDRYKPNLCLSPRVWGKHIRVFYRSMEQPRVHSYWALVLLRTNRSSKGLGIVLQNRAAKGAKSRGKCLRTRANVTKLPNTYSQGKS